MLDFPEPKISYHEFLAATISRREVTENNLKSAFDILSKHEDYIKVEHIRDVLGADEDKFSLEEMFQELGILPDGKISYEKVFCCNFKALMILIISSLI
jgi:Ca2+-binding EF-hand superfamily protein